MSKKAEKRCEAKVPWLISSYCFIPSRKGRKDSVVEEFTTSQPVLGQHKRFKKAQKSLISTDLKKAFVILMHVRFQLSASYLLHPEYHVSFGGAT